MSRHDQDSRELRDEHLGELEAAALAALQRLADAIGIPLIALLAELADELDAEANA